MPFPFALAGLLLSLAGTGASIAAAQRTKSQMNDALAASLRKQRQRENQAQGVVQQSIAKSTRASAEQQLAQGAQQSRAEYQKLNQIPVSSATVPFGASPQQQQIVGAENAQSNDARAQLMGYSNYDLLQAIKNLRAQQQLGVIGNFAQGDLGLLPLQMQAAQHSNDLLGGAGGLASSLGGYFMQQPGQQSALGAGSLNAPWNATAWRH